MFTTQIGEVTVHFDFRPLIIFLLITAIITAIVCFLILFFHLIRTLVLEFKFRNIAKKISYRRLQPHHSNRQEIVAYLSEV